MNISTLDSIWKNIMKSNIETSLDRFNGARTITIKFFRGGIDPVSFLQTIKDIKKKIIWISLGFFDQSGVVCVWWYALAKCTTAISNAHLFMGYLNKTEDVFIYV